MRNSGLATGRGYIAPYANSLKLGLSLQFVHTGSGRIHDPEFHSNSQYAIQRRVGLYPAPPVATEKPQGRTDKTTQVAQPLARCVAATVNNSHCWKEHQPTLLVQAQ